jgi:hypothetical protein
VRPLIGHAVAPEEALADYLAAASERFAAAPGWTSDGDRLASLSAEFEHLRWFDLPLASVDA